MHNAGPKDCANPLIKKLASFVDLAEDDVAALHALCTNQRMLEAGHSLIEEGDRPENVFLLLEGWAYRYKHVEDGNRQIVAYLIPGDLCDIHIFILKAMDHGIALLSEARVAAIPKHQMTALLRDRPNVAQALFWATLVDEATLREWLLNMGRRDAFERIAHLFCEMWLRLSQVGLVSDAHQFSLPVTQEQLGDTVGLTSVHVNRVLQRMRQEGLIELAGRQLRILDLDRMKEVAGFDPNYLHLERRD